MAEITIADIKALRERTGAGMTDTKNALVEADGDIELAVDILRKKGQSRLAKREGNATSEGVVAAVVGEGSATMIELSCETDFVAKGEKFIALSEAVLAAAAAAKANSVDEALAAPAAAGTVADLIAAEAGVLNEKTELRRVVTLTGEKFAVYLHKTSQDLPPQIGVIVAYTGDDAETARSIAQHISFANPTVLTREDVPAEDVERERAVVTEISLAEGKPEAALPKIIEGRLGAYFKQVALLEQEYAKDNKLSIAQVLEQSGLTVTGFARFKVGA